jgi:predicted MPP superfamily phosphohydrolase
MSTKYLVNEESLSGIADAIRTKIRSSDAIKFPVDFCSSIESLPIKPIFLPESYPSHVRQEVTRVAGEVQKVLKEDSIIFIALSDTHFENDPITHKNYLPTQRTAMAVKALTHVLPVDFICHLGDFCGQVRVGEGRVPITEEQVNEVVEYLKDAAGNIPVFCAIGNHDASDSTIPGSWFYNNFAKQSKTTEDSDDFISDLTTSTSGGYCYHDFNDKYLRVFVLNTSEQEVEDRDVQYGDNISGKQLKWLADKIVDLNNKSKPDLWSFIILSHFPADYGGIKVLSNLLYAYVTGDEDYDITGTYDGNEYKINFNDNNPKFLAQFHGHIHNLLHSKLHKHTTEPREYDAYRFCVSSVDNIRINHDAYNGLGFSFQDPKGDDLVKEAGKASETSFVVNVINRSDNLIHSFHYGAGRDRLNIDISYSCAHTYVSSVTRDPTCTTAGVKTFTCSRCGDSYTEAIEKLEHNYLNDICITCGLRNPLACQHDYAATVTAPTCTEQGYTIYTCSSCGDSYVDSYTDPTGHTYVDGICSICGCSYTNQLAIATANYNGGGVYGAESGNAGFKTDLYISSASGFPEEQVDGMCCTGYIPAQAGDTVYLKNISLDGPGNYKFAVYLYSTPSAGAEAVGAKMAYLRRVSLQNFEGPDENGVYSFVIPATIDVGGSLFYPNTKAIRITAGNITSDTVITVNENISGTSKIYTNVLSKAVDKDGLPYGAEGCGYKTDTRINSNTEDVDVSGMCCTGYIPVYSSNIVRIKNITVDAPQTVYALAYASLGSNFTQLKEPGTSISVLESCMQDDGTIVIKLDDYCTNVKFLRISVGNINENTIITLDEEII